MRLTTWNVNSIRARVDRVIAFLERSGTDVLAMQEIKCKPEQFPREPFEAAGYEVAIHGVNQWNGVAIASRVGLSEVATDFGQPAFDDLWEDPDVDCEPGAERDPWAGQETPPEARALGATCGGVRVWSVYVPNGREIGHPHLRYKIAFLNKLAQQAGEYLGRDSALPLALVGDWNVVPTDEDIWDTTATGGLYLTDAERAAYGRLAQAGLQEVTRERVTNYTFWDYQRLAFPKNHGMRIDYIWTSADLAARTIGAEIDRDERKGKGASDHVPVIADFEV